ncbi:MAG: hypothetical protein HKN36_02840 [Hellea sp.]|nr:hypothetical protein [Hellea sp.]
MNNKVKWGLAAGLSALLIACSGGGDGSDAELKVLDHGSTQGENGIDFLASKYDGGKDSCLYSGSEKVPNQGSAATQAQFLTAQMVFIGHEPKTGAFARFQIRNKAIRDAANAALLKADYKALEALIAPLRPGQFELYDYIPLERGQNDDTFIPNPFDLKLDWYQRIGFYLLDDTERFADSNPFRVAVGKPNAASPFRSMSPVSDHLLAVDYVSLPPRENIKGYDTISDRKCLYYYDINIIQRFTDNNGHVFQVPVTIDPGGEGSGGPPGTDPPLWP